MTNTDYLTIASLTGELVVYRNLEPCDATLPGLAQLRARLGLPPHVLPRKRDADYARVIFEMLRHRQAQRSDQPLQVLLVLGDTNNDRWMAAHLRTASGLPVFAFIGDDDLAEEPGYTWEGDSATATRWALLPEWYGEVTGRCAADNGELPWEQTALLLDIDKTLLGPRGRCDDAINEARAEAVLRVAQVLFGPELDVAAFNTIYSIICRSEFHDLTLDNQDYIAYITLLLAQGILPAQEFLAGLQDGRYSTFTRLLDAAGPRIPRISLLSTLHANVAAAHAAGDPTPFKDFRRTEFAATVARMADGRLTFCREVVALARLLVAHGVLCLAASDKPAESALPTPEQAAAGLLPLHHMPARLG